MGILGYIQQGHRAGVNPAARWAQSPCHGAESLFISRGLGDGDLQCLGEGLYQHYIHDSQSYDAVRRPLLTAQQAACTTKKYPQLRFSAASSDLACKLLITS